MEHANSHALAVDGGSPVRDTPFPPWPYFAPDEIDAARQVLASGKVNYWTGDACKNFERAFAEYTGCRYAISLANGTLALELALYTLGIGPGDEVIVPARTFIASASCAIARGATPVIAEVDSVTQNLTAETVRAALSPRTRAIIAVHLAGWPCDMDPILDLARAHDIKVIEDCAQAHGASYKGRPVGGLGDIAAFSFCQDKIMTTGGEGGMLVLNDTKQWKNAWAYKDHGKSWDAAHNRQHPPGFRWLHESFGSNWRMTEMQAAIGLCQLGKLDKWRGIRQAHATLLSDCFSKIGGLRITPPPVEIGHAYYKYYVFLAPEKLKPDWDQTRVIAAINAEGVPCFGGSCSEIYLEQAFVKAGFGPAERLPVARALGETSLMFLLHPTLGENEMRDTCVAVSKVMRAATRERA
jgi:dTDP-4-amino-4,6-dideoxygalactose transaminase